MTIYIVNQSTCGFFFSLIFQLCPSPADSFIFLGDGDFNNRSSFSSFFFPFHSMFSTFSEQIGDYFENACLHAVFVSYEFPFAFPLAFILPKAMENALEQTDFDYSFVDATARVALYDDLKSAPRITKIEPAKTNEFIERLATTVYEQLKLAGGSIPYTLIREVSENFIHAQFREIVVSILDDGNTVRFADQGPGIREKEKAQQPGFSSAIEPMKDYIRGVGSGFPIVKDYLDDRNGSIIIEDNLTAGAVVTISLVNKPRRALGERGATPPPRIPLSEREKSFVMFLQREGELGVSELAELSDTAVSTTHNTLRKLEEAGVVEISTGKKRSLTALGYDLAATL